MSRARRSGFLAGRFAAAELCGESAVAPPATTALGALLGHITGGADAKTFQPMNVNFGLFPEPPAKTRGKDRKKAQSVRALADLDIWLAAPKSRRRIVRSAGAMRRTEQPDLAAMDRHAGMAAQRIVASLCDTAQEERYQRGGKIGRQQSARGMRTARAAAR